MAAAEAEDTAELVALLDSNEPFDDGNAMRHPWMAKPRTVAALAAGQLAIFADSNDEFKDKIRNAGGVHRLVEWLPGNSEDRLHAAVMCLSFLSENSSANCAAIREAGGMPKLVSCLGLPPPELKSEVAITCRSMICLDSGSRSAFLAAGGVRPLVMLLEEPENGEARRRELQHSAVLCLRDFVGVDNAEVDSFAAAAKTAGAVPKLQTLATLEGELDKELSEHAHALLVRLAD